MMWLTSLAKDSQAQVKVWLYKNVLVAMNSLLYLFYSHLSIHSVHKYLLITQCMWVIGLSAGGPVMNRK